MSKKNFKTAFDSLLGENEPKTQEKPSRNDVRATFIIKADHQEKLKSVAYIERKMIKDVLDEALSNYFESYEKNNGPIQHPKTK